MSNYSTNVLCRKYFVFLCHAKALRETRLTTGVEVDFIIGNAQIAIEVKGKEKINSSDLKGLRQFKIEHPKVKRLIIVSLEKTRRITNDNILILPYRDFIKGLWNGKIA